MLSTIVLLGAFIWIQEAWRARQAVRVAREIRLFDLDAGTLEWIQFEVSNQVVRCVHENGVWMAGDGDGNRGVADVALIQHMISGLNSMGKGSTITQKHLDLRGFDETQYGFNPPMATISALDNNGESQWLVGRRTPLGGMVYAKKANEDDIYTLQDKLLAIIPPSHDILRDRVLFPGEAATLRRIEIRGSAGFVELVKEPSVGWKIQQPVSGQADPKEVDSFTEKLYLFRIEEFIADSVLDFSVYGLQGESRQISVVSGDGVSRMLVVGDDVPEKPGFVYARRADDTSVFTVSADILPLLNVPRDRFRKANVLTVPLETVSSVSVKKGNEQLDFAVDEEKQWEIQSPVSWDADARIVSDLIVFWSAALITEFDVETNTAPAEWIFEIGSAEAGVTNRIEVLPGQGRKDGLYIRMDDDPVLYQINIAMIPDVVIDPLKYKDRTVWKLEKDAVKKVSVVKNGQGPLVVERFSGQEFQPSGTNGTVKVNDVLFNQLLDQLEVIKASEYIAYNPAQLEPYGLADPSLELYVGLSNSNELGRVLLIGNETPDGYYSMVKGRDVIFYLEKEQVANLSADFLGVVEPVLTDPTE
jgi:hypothetical protein